MIGLISGLTFVALAIRDDLRGKIDHKFGPAWKSGMTYLLAGSMMIPILNFFWVKVMFMSLMEKK